MAEQFENTYSSQLNGAIDNSVTTLTVDAVPVNMKRNFRIRIDDEIILVGTVSGLTFTGCTRGVEGTTAASHSDNAVVKHVLTAAGLQLMPSVFVPDIENYAATYDAATSSTTVTMTAPTAGRTIVAVVYSTGRGCNSITQTDVTWTQRYTNNGNSQYLEVWTGVVAAATDTTAVFAFTGSNKQFCETFQLPDAPAFTTATGVTTSTNSSGTLSTISAGITPLDWLIWGVSANSPSSSYSGSSLPYRYLSATGGAGRGGIFRAMGETVMAWSISSSAVQYFMALVKLS